jgi:leader peptidase (prepilin peptidase) / N-methyltransferase
MLLVRAVILFLLGISIGSFLNVLIDRIPKDLSILGRSVCDHCKHKLGILGLIPLLSFIILRGHCRYCGKAISPRNFIVELLTGSLFVFTSYSLGTFNAELLYTLFIISVLIAIFFIDLKHQIIPDNITYPAILVSLLYLLFNEQILINNFVSGASASLFFFSLFLITKGRGLGFGDIKLAFLLGLFLGSAKVVVAIYTAFLTGAAFGLILILWRKKGLKDKIAFGPFLVLGTLISYFFGEEIMDLLWSSFL